MSRWSRLFDPTLPGLQHVAVLCVEFACLVFVAVCRYSVSLLWKLHSDIHNTTVLAERVHFQSRITVNLKLNGDVKRNRKNLVPPPPLSVIM